MKSIHAVFLGSVVALSAVASVAQAASPLTGNISVTNNYVWRGVTQTNDQSAVQGGADYDFGNGFTIGAWASNVSNGTEVDLYGAYKINLGKDTSLDLGAIKYKYQAIENADFLEAFAKFNFQKLVVGAYLTVDKDANPTQEDDLYLNASYSFDIGKDKTLTLSIGNYDFDAEPTTGSNTNRDYTHYRAALTKGEFTFALDDNDYSGTAGDTRVSITWSKAFDL